MKNKKGIGLVVILWLVFIVSMVLFSQIQDKTARFGALFFGGIMLGSIAISFSMLVYIGPKKDSFTYGQYTENGIVEKKNYDTRAFTSLLIREGELTAQMAEEVVRWIQNTRLPKATLMNEIRFNADYCISCYGFAKGVTRHSFILGVLQGNGIISNEEYQVLLEELKNKAIKEAFK